MLFRPAIFAASVGSNRRRLSDGGCRRRSSLSNVHLSAHDQHIPKLSNYLGRRVPDCLLIIEIPNCRGNGTLTGQRNRYRHRLALRKAISDFQRRIPLPAGKHSILGRSGSFRRAGHCRLAFVVAFHPPNRDDLFVGPQHANVPRVTNVLTENLGRQRFGWSCRDVMESITN